MDIPVDHKPNTYVSIQLHEYQDEAKRPKVLDIRFWHVRKDGTKRQGKGVRFPVEHAEQLAHRLLRLHKRYVKPEREPDDVVEDGFSQKTRVAWE